MFSSGAKIDAKELEEQIRKEIDEKRKRLFTDEDLDELQKMELNIIPNPDRVRPFFHRPLDFGDIPNLSLQVPDMKFYDKDYNIDIHTFLPSSSGSLLQKLRALFRPFFRLYGNIDALIHKQAKFNQEQAQFNASMIQSVEDLHKGVVGNLEKLEKPFHYIRVLHTLINYLVSELTKLSLSHQMLKAQVDALAYDVDQLRQRERLIERTLAKNEAPPPDEPA